MQFVHSRDTTSAHFLQVVSARAPLTTQSHSEMGIELDHFISALEALIPLAKVIPEPVGGPLEGILDVANQILKFAKVRTWMASYEAFKNNITIGDQVE